VLLLFDVVDTGGFMRRVREGIKAQEPRAIYAVAILNQGEPKKGLIALANTEREQRLPSGTQYELVYDDLEGKTKVGPIPNALKDEVIARETLRECLDGMHRTRWLQWLQDCDAIQFDRTLDKRKYTLFFDIPKVIHRFPHEVTEHAIEILEKLADPKAPRVLVYPAKRAKRVGTLVRFLAEGLGWPSAALGSKKASQYVFDRHGHVERSLRACQGRALVVDCAIRTGETLQGLAAELRNIGAKELAAFYVMDALYDSIRERFQENEQINIKSCFRLPLAMPSTNLLGPFWHQRFKDTLTFLDATRELSMEAAEAIRQFCQAKLNDKGRRSSPKRRSSEAVIDEDCCMRVRPHSELDRTLSQKNQGRGRLIKRLDINQVLRDPLIQYKLAGVVANSAPRSLKEWCILALCKAERFDLFSESCLTLPDSPIMAPNAAQWGILPFVALDASRGNPSAAEKMRDQVRKVIDKTKSGFLLPETDQQNTMIIDRCEILDEILTSR
jgi:hypothetical protein